MLYTVAVIEMIEMIAQTTTSQAMDQGTLGELLPYANLGLAGAFLVAFLKSWIVPGGMYKEANEERKKIQEDYKTVVEMVQTKVLPEMERNRETNEELVKLLSKALEN